MATETKSINFVQLAVGLGVTALTLYVAFWAASKGWEKGK